MMKYQRLEKVNVVRLTIICVYVCAYVCRGVCVCVGDILGHDPAVVGSTSAKICFIQAHAVI